MANNVKGYQKIAAAALASAQSLTIPTGADRCWIQCDAAANVRYTLDGTTPTATEGMILIAGAHRPIELTLAAGMAAAKFILESGSPNLYVTYFGSSS